MTATAIVRATTPNPGNTIRPGQSVHAVLFGFSRPNTMIVPREAVMQTPRGSSVYVLDEDGVTVRARPVVAGEWVRRAWIIEEGLAPGERVIVDGLTRIQPGMRVRPVRRELRYDEEIRERVEPERADRDAGAGGETHAETTPSEAADRAAPNDGADAPDDPTGADAWDEHHPLSPRR